MKWHFSETLLSSQLDSALINKDVKILNSNTNELYLRTILIVSYWQIRAVYTLFSIFKVLMRIMAAGRRGL